MKYRYLYGDQVNGRKNEPIEIKEYLEEMVPTQVN